VSCEPTTCVRDHARAARLDGRYRYSNEQGIGKIDAPLRNTQGGHKKEPKSFCCVTTRPARARNPGPVVIHRTWFCGAPPAERVAGAPRPHEPRVPPAAGDVPLVAWRPASDAPASGISGLGSTAGSNAGPCKRGHTLDADRCGGQDTAHWWKGTSRGYVGIVPREVLAPEGAARETPMKSLGHSFEWLTSFVPLTRDDQRSLNLAGSRSAAHEAAPTARPPHLGPNEASGDCTTPPKRNGGEEDKEGDQADIFRLRRRRK